MESDQDQGVAKTLFPTGMHFLFDVLGLLPIRFVNDGSIQFNYRSLLQLVTLFLFYFWATFSANLLTVNKETTSTTKMLFKIYITSVPLGAFFICSVNAIKCWQGKFGLIVKNLSTFYRFMRSKSVKPVSEMKCLKVVPLMVSLFYGFVMTATENYLLYSPQGYLSVNWRGFIHNITVLYLYLLLSNYTCIVWSVGQNFSNINELVKLLISHYENDGKELPIANVEEVRELHHLMCRTVEDTNSFFGLQLVVVFMHVFMCIIYSPFVIIALITKDLPVGNHLSLWLLHISSFLFPASQLLSVIYVSERATHHARATRQLLSKLLHCDLPSAVRTETKMALSQMDSSSVQFSVLGMMHIDYPIITKLCGLMVSYVMILLQIENASSLKAS